MGFSLLNFTSCVHDAPFFVVGLLQHFSFVGSPKTIFNSQGRMDVNIVITRNLLLKPIINPFSSYKQIKIDDNSLINKKFRCDTIQL